LPISFEQAGTTLTLVTSAQGSSFEGRFPFASIMLAPLPPGQYDLDFVSVDVDIEGVVTQPELAGGSFSVSDYSMTLSGTVTAAAGDDARLDVTLETQGLPGTWTGRYRFGNARNFRRNRKLFS
jgi:hypothetical protein